MIDNNQYLICGGVNTNQTVHVTLQDDTIIIKQKSDIPIKTFGHQLVCYNRKNIFAIGGRNTQYYNVCRRYDFEEDTWSTMSPMKTARCYFGTQIILNRIIDSFTKKIFAFGGSGQVRSLADIECYSIEGDSWNVLNFKMMNPIYGFSYVQTDSQKVLIMGGQALHTQYLVYEMDLENSTIQKFKNLNQARFFNMNQAVKLGDEIYLFGGANQQGEIYNIERIDYKEQTTTLLEISWKDVANISLNKFPVLLQSK